MTLRRQLQSVICCFSVLWLLATARSCSYVNNVFSSMSNTDADGQSTAPTGRIFDQLTAEPTNSVCKVGQTCCSVQAQKSLQERVATNYTRNISTIVSTQMSTCLNNNFTGALIKHLSDSKNNLVSDMLRVFSIYFQPYVTLFDSFYSYLQQTVTTGNTCQLSTKFHQVFFELFLAAYVSNPSTGGSRNLPNTEAFRSCFYDYFLELRGDTIANYYRGFTRSYNRTMYYLRALRTADSILASLLDHQLNKPCRDSLMKMSHCASCSGYNDSARCQGMCLNTLRGCLVDLSDLVTPFREFSDAVVAMKESLDDQYSLWVQLDLLQSNFFRMVSTTFSQASDIAEGVSLRCTAAGPRTKRQSPGVSVNTRAILVPPRAEMNQSAYCYRNLPTVLSSLPELLCGDGGVTNQNCWNGRAIGSYDRDVIAFSRLPQQNNPEVFMCGEQRYRGEIRQLQLVTRELNILTGRHTCSQDDEDCSVDLEAVCDYQVFNVTVEASDGSMDSFSGSGFGSGDGGNTCDEGQITGTTPTVSTTGTTGTTSTTPTGTTPTSPTTDTMAPTSSTPPVVIETISTLTTDGFFSSDLPSSLPPVVVEVSGSDNPDSVESPPSIIGSPTAGASTVLPTLTVVAMGTMTTVLSVLL